MNRSFVREQASCVMSALSCWLLLSCFVQCHGQVIKVPKVPKVEVPIPFPGVSRDHVKNHMKAVQDAFGKLKVPYASRPVDQDTFPKGKENTSPDVILYVHADGKGWRVPIYKGEHFDSFVKIPVENGKQNFNDKLSSLRVLGDVTVHLYEHIDYAGKHTTFNGKGTVVKQVAPNDFFSSCKVE